MNPSDLKDELIAPGTMIGEYRVEQTLAEGGMGLIYSGVHPVISKRVAIKVISKQIADNPRAVTRFIMEARSVNQIGHHNIVDIFSIGELPDERTYLIMELLEGMSLHELLMKARSLPPGKVLPIYEQLCDALGVIHQKGFVHRDLKPPNIFVLKRPPFPFVKILDFGLAKLWSQRSSKITEVGMVLGTPEYMSPEQCRGKEVDSRTDIYALGVMLYELLTGEQPFSDPSPFEVLTCHLTKEPRPPSELMETIPPSLEWVILKAMAKEPEQRFGSAAELLEAFRLAVPERLLWQHGQDFHAAPRSPGEGLALVSTGPLVLPPEELDIQPGVEPYALDDDDEGDTQVSDPRLRRVSTSERGLDLLEIDEEAESALGGPMDLARELDLRSEDSFIDPVSSLLEVNTGDDATLRGPPSLQTSDSLMVPRSLQGDSLQGAESLELMEVNIDGEETAALPGDPVRELYDRFEDRDLTPGPEPIVELNQRKAVRGSDEVIELRQVKPLRKATIPGLTPGPTEGAGMELNLDLDSEDLVSPASLMPPPAHHNVILGSTHTPNKSAGRPSTDELAAFEDTMIKAEPLSEAEDQTVVSKDAARLAGAWPKKKLPPIPDGDL